ncbi:MAG: LptF/LptG family permease [Flavobacteriia bacterium]|nr:LptF/LptG family permease [Flavobacteriia bacterium]
MLGIVMLFSMVFDISERLSEFIENKAELGDILFKYYLNFIVYYGNTFSSLIVFLSVIWFTAKMAQESEIIPILFSGKSFVRMLYPYFIASTILVIISFTMNHFILPLSNKTRLDFEEQFYRDRIFVENYHAEFPGQKIIYFKSYNSDENIVVDLRLEQWDKSKPKVFISAKTAVNEKGTKKWTLNNYFIRKIGAINDSIVTGAKLDTVLTFKVSDMAMRDNQVETMTYSELKHFIEVEKRKGNPEVPLFELKLHERSSLPFATYFLTLMGVSVSSRKKRGGIGINIAIGLLFVFIYIFTMQVTSVSAEKIGLHPVLAVWIPNILFGLLGYIMYRFAPK